MSKFEQVKLIVEAVCHAVVTVTWIYGLKFFNRHRYDALIRWSRIQYSGCVDYCKQNGFEVTYNK